MELTMDRLKHSLAVAKKMKKLATEETEKYPVDPNEAFLVGILHDIGYEFVDDQKEHAQKGGIILKEQGYVYWKEVFYHGYLQKEYESAMLNLLNYVDITTGPTGEYVSVEQRIKDIEERYGKDSIQANEVKLLAESLGE